MKLLSVIVVVFAASLAVTRASPFPKVVGGGDLVGDDIFEFLAERSGSRVGSHQHHHRRRGDDSDEEHHYHYIPAPQASKYPYVKTTLLDDKECKDLDPSTIDNSITPSLVITAFKALMKAVADAVKAANGE